MSERLPIDALREEFQARIVCGNVALSAPTGTGKSTVVPTWIQGRVTVVEPRRVACQALAARVAEERGERLGQSVGYVVRGRSDRSQATTICYVTPGIALRESAWLEADCLVIDEFHERRLDVDLILALALHRGARVAVMSATLQAERVAHYVGGVHLSAETRRFPVRIRYLSGGETLPHPGDLARRVGEALDCVSTPGHVLIFLPGKAEIRAVAQALRHRDCSVIPLHGGLPLSEQAAVFAPSERRKLVLATNVAETSLTVPGVTAVIDSGLVRRTRYHDGRGYLTLAPVALDSAEQRAGRAGRTAPGECIRLWSEAARLESVTPPEVFRESLVPLVLGAASLGCKVSDLGFLDPPKQHAVDAARQELLALGALDAEERITVRGRAIERLPIDPWLGRLVVEAERARDARLMAHLLALVAALSVDRSLTLEPRAVWLRDAEPACDLLVWCRIVLAAPAPGRRVQGPAVDEARDVYRRLSAALGVAAGPREADPFNVLARPTDRDALLDTIFRADPRAAYVARRRKARVAWSNGGTECELARESCVADAERTEALIALASHAGGMGMKRRIVLSVASPVSLSWLAKRGTGTARVSQVKLSEGRIEAEIERVYAGRTLVRERLAPRGELARDALVQLFLRGSVFPEAARVSRQRLRAAHLVNALCKNARFSHLGLSPIEVPDSLELWAQRRVAELGFEAGDELELLSPKDLTLPALDPDTQRALEAEFPLRMDLGDCVYEADYDLTRGQVTLALVQGQRSHPPPPGYLPRFGGLRVVMEAGGTMHVVRERKR